MNQTPVKLLDAVARDERVLDIVREAGVSDSRYVYTATLALGWQVDGCHYPCENSASALRRELGRITPCACDECVEQEVV